MSWLRISENGSTRLRQARFVVFAGLLSLAAAGCGFHPLYGPTASGADLREVMKRVQIANIPSRAGLRLRNELLFGATGGGAQLPPVYRLDIVLRESVRNTLVSFAGNPTGQIVQFDAEFRLVRIKDNEVVFKGASSSEAAYNLAGSVGAVSVYGDTRAIIDAENRAAITLADVLKTRLAAYLSGAA